MTDLTLAEIIQIKNVLDDAPVPEENRYINEDFGYTLADYQLDASETLGPDADPKMLALGVGGEAGEVLEIIKKGHRPGREVDVPHLKEEIGDVLWYLANLAKHYGLSLEDIALDNIAKLIARYGEK